MPVHPRVCGELAPSRRKTGSDTGSSPRLRGTPHARLPGRFFQRFIPASAGNSAETNRRAADCPVHPRVCGELADHPISAAGLDGSSPRLRGTLRLPVWRCSSERFIPASAGNSKSARSSLERQPVHPRVCGELGSWHSIFTVRHGSSPRLRGTRSVGGSGSGIERFIPASAGNSKEPRTGQMRMTVHPRVCGELFA